MASTTFIDNQTVIYAAWLNDVNNAVYNGTFVSPTITATNMVCNGVASGNGFTNLINNTFTSPGPIGSVTPNTGKFTTLQATSPMGVASGGTGQSTHTANAILVGAGTAAIGSIAPGSNGYGVRSNGSVWSAQQFGLGISGETYHAGGAFNTTYTNSSNYPTMIIVTATGIVGNLLAIVDSVEIQVSSTFNSSGFCSVSFIVPPGKTFAVNTAQFSSPYHWYQLY